MDTPSTWWTEDFVDLTSFTTTVVDERGPGQLNSMAGESDVTPIMKEDEITTLINVPNFDWLEEDEKCGVVSLTPSPGINSGKLYPPPGGKVISNFVKPAANNISSLVGRRDARLKLDLALTADPPQSSNTPSSFVQTSQIPMPKKEINLTTPDILGPLTDKNSEFNLLAYVFAGEKDPNDVDGKNANVLNTPEIKPELLNIPPSFTPQKIEPVNVLVIKEEPNESEESTSSPKNIVEKAPDATVKEEKKRRGPPPRRRPSRQKEKVAVVEPRIKIELDEYRPVLFRNKNNSLSENILFPPTKKRKLSTTSEDSSIMDEKYRELRDKNNEASRRSRMNRKSREVEMKQQAHELESTNLRLKAKAEELQRLVDRLRATLMDVMLRKC